MEKSNSQKSTLEILLSIFEKLVIPLLLVFIGYQQIKLNDLQEKRISEQSKSELEIKYLELFYQDITSKDKQVKSIGLLSIMNEDLALKLVKNMVLSNEEIPNEIKDKIPMELKNRAIIQSLNNYTIEFFYEQEPKKIKSFEQISNLLNRSGFKGVIKKTNLTDEFKLRLGLEKEHNCQIRFDPQNETDFAIYLKDQIGKVYNNNNKVLKIVGRESPNYISIIL